MDRAYAIALNAFREAVRDRVLFGVLGLALASLLFGTSLAWLSVNEHSRVLIDHGIVTISWLANLVAIFLGASFLYKEVELRTLYVILAKPVARWQFVLGRYLGIVATAVVFVALTSSALLVLLDFVVAESHGTGSSIVERLRGSRSTRALILSLATMGGGLALLALSKLEALAKVRAATSGAGLLLGSTALLGVVATHQQQRRAARDRVCLDVFDDGGARGVRDRGARDAGVIVLDALRHGRAHAGVLSHRSLDGRPSSSSREGSFRPRS
jgi:ABC-type transport system involved in multi-copper enzyme maturation permease subunit